MVAPFSIARPWLRQYVHAQHAAKPSVPEYTEGDDLEDDDDFDVEPLVVAVEKASPRRRPAEKSSPVPVHATGESPAKPKVQYAALEPGTVVQIQVGDIGLARKAWKKRRRSDSPLLVPCSVLNVDRQSTTRWNLIYLLEKFGASYSGGIRISASQLAKRHRTHLKSPLAQHANALGSPTNDHLLQTLFNKQIQDTYGVKLVESGGELWLHAPLSRFRAQKRANAAAVLQFSEKETPDDTLSHTGVVRNRRPDGQTDKKSDMYQLQPLSAALRVSQKEDVDTGHIQNGSLHPAVVFDYDPAGDAGSPLLTLSLNPARNQVRDRLKISDRKHQPIHNPKYMLDDLKVGHGPIEGKVVRLVKGGAIVDCAVGRKLSNMDEEELVKVFGYLSFKDAVAFESSMDASNRIEGNDDELDDEDEDEEWDEILSIDDLGVTDEDDEDDEDESGGDDAGEPNIEDILLSDLENDEEFANSEDVTHLYSLGADGSLMFNDPETGESKVLGNISDDEETDAEDEIVLARTVPYRPRTAAFKSNQSPMRSQRLHVGDRLEVFVKSASKKSSQLSLTMNPAVHGMTAKDLKKEAELSKKLARLAKQLGGLHRIQQLAGRECDGIVQATSHTGDWLYVLPNMTEERLPVGVASIDIDDEVLSQLGKGDAVRLQIQGIDEYRGQLSMKVLCKLSP